MSDLQKILFTALLAPLIVALVIGIIKWLFLRKEDQPRVNVNLSFTASMEVLQSFGCPCAVVHIIGASKRPTYIASVELSMAIDKEFIKAFEKGFGLPFSQGTPKELTSARFFVQLVPVPRSKGKSVILKRDDVAEYFLPVPFKPYELFLDAPSNNVEVAMRTADKKRKVIASGERIQEIIRNTINLQDGQLKGPKINIQVGISQITKNPPQNVKGVGMTNPGPIDLPDPD